MKQSTLKLMIDMNAYAWKAWKAVGSTLRERIKDK